MIIVGKDNNCDFNSISAALNSISNNNTAETKIYIKNGIYKEKLSITKPFVTLVGEDVHKTIVTYDDYAKKLLPDNTLYRTFNTYTIFIGSNNFSAQNITFENSSGNGDIVGQAVAAYVEGDNAFFKNCRFLGNQDTLFTGPLPPSPIEGNDFGGPMEGKDRIVGHQLYEDCYIEGDIDFIFGSACAVFKNCEIFSKDKGMDINGYVTASSSPIEEKIGYVFIDCRLTSNAPKNTVYLGRPWRDYAKTIFINCYLGEHIKKEGWHSWNKENAEKNSYYGEYKSYGPGASDETRCFWSHILTKPEVDEFMQDLSRYFTNLI